MEKARNQAILKHYVDQSLGAESISFPRGQHDRSQAQSAGARFLTPGTAPSHHAP